MSQFFSDVRSHSQRVCRLYKEAMRLIESYYVYRPIVRYHQVQLRHLFDKNKSTKDMMEARRLLFLGEHDLFSLKNPMPMAKFPRSPLGLAGGVAAERVVQPPDWVMDYWHPVEKALYPEYFATREKRKKEFISKWSNGELC